MKIAIIGAGAAGIIAAITAKRKNKNLHIDLFDINDNIGKKILASGNGRCNISNTNLKETNYIGEDPSFVSFALKNFTFENFENFCKSIGLLLDIKDNSKVYPLSNEAKSVTKLLENTCKNLNISIILNTKIIDIKKNKDSFILISENKNFANYDKVAITSGLGAAPQLNANEIGMQIALKFGHTSNLTYPSLVGLHTDFQNKSKIQGIKKVCEVTLYINGVEENKIVGDVLFTRYGLSGFAILDISQYAVYPLKLSQEIQISINLFPNLTKNELLNILQNLFKNLENEKAVLLLSGFISNKLAPIILENCNICKESKAKEINSKQIRSILNNLINWRFKIIDTQGFKHAEASGGGIRTNEIDNKSYESKLCKNLYFAGEVLDIVGNRGGYNLHFAWASGYLLGKNITSLI